MKISIDIELQNTASAQIINLHSENTLKRVVNNEKFPHTFKLRLLQSRKLSHQINLSIFQRKHKFETGCK